MELEMNTGNIHEIIDFYKKLSKDILYFFTDHNHLILDISDSLLSLTGLTKELATGKSLDELFKTNAGFDNQPDPKEVFFNTGQTAYHFTVQSSLFCDNITNETCRLFILSDITELKKRETEYLQEIEVKKKFFSLIAHDLKGPVSTILGLSRFLLEESENYGDEQLSDIATTIYRVSENTHNLILNLLEWSRIQAGKLSMNPVMIPLKSFTKNVLTVIQVQAESKNIDILLDYPPNLKVFADENMLESVIRNLVSNAIKFSYPDGSITIKAEKTGDFITLTVSDKGKGIAESEKNKLFASGLNYSTTGTQDEKGTGIGLILCKEFIEQHHGRIWFESREGEGSNFHFTIPGSAKVFSSD